MFLRFAVENHASFHDEAVLSFVSTANTDAPDWRMPHPKLDYGILPAVGIWGANASGKSQLVNALRFLRLAVRDSQNKWEPTGSLPWNPFKMQPDAGPTRMQLDFVIGPARYAFGFTFTATGFVEEWLYRWQSHRRQTLYHRDTRRPEGRVFHWPSLGGPREAAAEIVRPNSLFLSAATQNGNETLTRIRDKIVDGMCPEQPIRLRGYPVFDRSDPIIGPLMPRLTRLLREADLGVVGVEVEDVPEPDLDGDEFEATFTEAFLARMRATRGKSRADRVRLRLKRRDPEDGDAWDLPPGLESRGTHIFLARCRDILPVLDSGGLLVIDELETSLHPDLCGRLVDLFTREATNPNGAQLLFTTHVRDLLARLRRDEVALIDKEAGGRSVLVAASDFRGIRKRDDLRVLHRRGQLGGVPDVSGLLAAMGELR